MLPGCSAQLLWDRGWFEGLGMSRGLSGPCPRHGERSWAEHPSAGTAKQVGGNGVLPKTLSRGDGNRELVAGGMLGLHPNSLGEGVPLLTPSSHRKLVIF